MLYELQDSLGLIDARKCINDFGATIDIKKPWKKGDSLELNERSASYLSKKYPALLKPAGNVKGEAKRAEVTGPAK